MKISPLEIKGAWVAKSNVNVDSRGSFREWFQAKHVFEQTGYNFDIQQANISKSEIGVVRGIHFSLALSGQAKWVTCVSGKIRDVIVDIRLGSPTFGKWISIDISAEEGTSILIEPTLGHGFSALESNTTVVYLLSSPYSPSEEFGIFPFDEDLAIEWGLEGRHAKVSPKDSSAPKLASIQSLNLLPKYASK
jgi:dTDP-4-dehydrorhamnose 3,5-epimerase